MYADDVHIEKKSSAIKAVKRNAKQSSFMGLFMETIKHFKK